MICRAIPYEGTESYLFVSYCHADKEAVYPLLETLASSGFRFWYDDGNHCGDDWLESIENHLEECSACLAFISGNSSLSHNCKSEIVYALKCQKKVIPVLIDGAELPKGLRMQLSYLHYIKRSDYPSDQLLLQKIQEAEELQSCKVPAGSIPLKPYETTSSAAAGDPPQDDFWKSHKEIHVSASAERQEDPVSPKENTEENPIQQGQNRNEENKLQMPRHNVVSNEGDTVQHQRGNLPETKAEEKAELTDTPKNNPVEPDEKKSAAGDSSNNSQPTYDRQDVKTPVDETKCVNPDETVVVPRVDLAMLFQPAVNRYFILRKPQTKLGRSPIKCDVVIEGNYSISKYHADLMQYRQKMFLRDANSTNGTYIGNNRIGVNSNVELENPAVFQLNDETLVLISGNKAQKVLQDRTVVFLMNESHSAVQFMESDVMYLDRNHKWPDGTLSDLKVHRSGHARLQKKHGAVYLIDDAPDYGNSTYLNDSALTHGEARVLSSGDKIQLGDTVLFFSIIPI